ncbi:MAG: cupin domain-containing protein [Phormidesmis sp.]
MKAYIVAFAALFVTACAAPPKAAPSETTPSEQSDIQPERTEQTLPPGANQVLRSPLTLAEDLEVIISDMVIPPGGTVPRHYHPGEEFVYVLEGSAVHQEEGQPDEVLEAGDARVIVPGAVHSLQGGEQGARAIVFRVHVEGEAERIFVEE